MPLGKNQVFLPNFTIGLLRTKHLPPTSAQFIVPLNFTKLDLKDYLLHAYNVKVLSVRSYVVQQKVQRIKNLEEQRREWYRPRAIKKMTVELEKPFIYPPEPTDLSPWDNKIHKAAKEYQEKMRDNHGLEGKRKPDMAQRTHIFELARETLGLKKDEVMEEVEVDKDQR
ncbi:ribosomal protein L23-domain-containing protein [Kalaharituber pfeilii]|nr:ribosomal protein L23-domain-containing protein [Kalaharituber pfeilii]